MSRRRRPQLLMAGLVFLTAAAALVRAGSSLAPPDGPPSLAAGPAEYRDDGGQTLGAGGYLTPNPLTSLNLGRKIVIPATSVWCLEALPGLGAKSAAKAREGGRLSSRAEKALRLITKNPSGTEPCDLTSP